MGKARLILSLFMIGLVAQSALCSSERRWNLFTEEESDSQFQKRITPFRAGQEYTFEYNGQVSSGLLGARDDQIHLQNVVDNSEYDAEKKQKAVLRIHSNAKITFNTEQLATLRLEKTLIGKLNHVIKDLKRVQPMQMFERKSLDEQKERELLLPVQFKYVNGVVEQIRFHPEDKPWSKNVKRAVLNLIQINLNRKNFEQTISFEEQNELRSNMPFTFTVPETTIEGNCMTTYTLNENKQRREQDDSELFKNDNELNNQFNVTKSINFKKCQRIADVAFGFQNQDEQTAKCARLNVQRLQNMQDDQQENNYEYTNEDSCDPKEVNDDKLDRVAIQRYELVGGASRKSFAIKRAEALSVYTLKNIKAEIDEQLPSAMHTVAIAELIFRGVKPSQNNAKTAHYQLKQLEGENIETDSLLFDNEWEIERKRFFMYGDAEISRESSPYRSVQHKVEQAKSIYQRLIQTTTDKTVGMEVDTVTQLQRLVEILRMCSVSELENIYNNVLESQKQYRAETEKIQQLLADTLAIAGTRNTIYVLVQKINNKKVSANQAVQALKSLIGIPAPSDAITDIVAGLCKNELAHRHPTLQQTCWLTFGAMVGELCRDKISAQALSQEQESLNLKSRQQLLTFGVQSGFDKSQLCPQTKKEFYQQALVHLYKNAETTYEKILALKAIGNAGLDNTVVELERIIVSGGRFQEPKIVRIVAIDSLRRLRVQMPRKIQRICLPVFQNTNEKPEIRMAALSLLINTTPEEHILDQLIYTLTKERSLEVKSFTYGIMKFLSQSKILEEQNIAKHLQSALKVTKFDEELYRQTCFSNKWQVPVYSAQQQEGFNLKWISVFSENQMLPVHIATGLDTIFNGKWQNDILKVSLSQQGTNRWIENLLESLSSLSVKRDMTRAARNNNVNDQQLVDAEYRDVVSRLGVKSRRNNNNRQQQEEVFLMACVRLGDIDHVVLPISEHNLPQYLKKVLENGEKLSLASVIAEIASNVEKKHVRWLSALNFNEKYAMIPTPVGLPLKIQQSTPMLSYVEAGAKVQPESRGFESSTMKTEVKAHSQVTLVHMQKMECWTPILSTGVESARGLELNLPMHFDIQTRASAGSSQQSEDKLQGLRLSWKVPQQPKTRLFGAHTMCNTFIQYNKSNKKEVRVIFDPILERTLQSVEINNKLYGENKFGLPIRVNGHFHLPREWSNYASIAQVLMATENHIHIELEQNANTPREIVLQAEGSIFRKTEAKQHTPELHNFYADAEKQFLPAYPEDVEGMETDDNMQRRQKLSKTLERLQQQHSKTQMYKHLLKVSYEVIGRKQAKAEMKLQAVCDAKFYYCKMFNEIQRSPIYADETSMWTLKQKIQTLVPESVSSVHELERLKSLKNQKFIAQIDNVWGTEERTQFINFRINGENAQTKQQLQWLEETNNEEQQYLLKRIVSFINKYDIVSDYKLNANSQNVIQRVFEVLKTYYFWNTESRLEQTGRDGQLFISAIIDPISQRQCNVSIRTPSQIVRIVNARLPMTICPMPLVRASQKPTHSIMQAFTRYTTKNRVECHADGRRVETFDGVLYKAPITKCYSVLAKDCSNVEQPKFTVLMKSISEDGQQKKIKVITRDQVIKCQPQERQIRDWKSQKIVCLINGKEINAERQMMAIAESSEEEYMARTVEYNNEEQSSATINVNGVSVRFGCQCADCECQRVWIKLADTHKNTQCGLCGHYDDNLADEWRTNTNELTQDLARFHQSFTLKDEEECTESKQSTFYNNNKNEFQILKNNRFNMFENSQEQTENMEEQQRFGGYVDEESNSNEEWNRISNGNQRVEEPKMKTYVFEQNERICFSVQPIKQCPTGTFNVQFEENIENVAPQKFACLLRSSSDARRLQRKVRQGKIADVTFEPNFVYSLSVPVKCVRYF